MKKTFAVIAALVLCLSAVLIPAAAEEDEAKTALITLEANPTTGYAWHGFVLGGESVELDSEEGSYSQYETDTPMVGVGGCTDYTVTAVKPGQSILKFTYLHVSEHEAAEEILILADVDEEGNLYLQDVTEYGMHTVTVAAVDEEEKTAVLMSETLGELLATFPEDMQLPAAEEEIVIYTNGTMTMSLPPIVNVIAWSAVMQPEARG